MTDEKTALERRQELIDAQPQRAEWLPNRLRGGPLQWGGRGGSSAG